MNGVTPLGRANERSLDYHLPLMELTAIQLIPHNFLLVAKRAVVMLMGPQV
jgi:hypothetical protein